MLVLRGEFGLAKKPRPTFGCPSVNHAGLYETIGFSVDSLNDETNKKIGRCDRNGKTIPSGRIVELCGLILHCKKDIREKGENKNGSFV